MWAHRSNSAVVANLMHAELACSLPLESFAVTCPPDGSSGLRLRVAFDVSAWRSQHCTQDRAAWPSDAACAIDAFRVIVFPTGLYAIWYSYCVHVAVRSHWREGYGWRLNDEAWQSLQQRLTAPRDGQRACRPSSDQSGNNHHAQTCRLQHVSCRVQWITVRVLSRLVDYSTCHVVFSRLQYMPCHV
jgi:hypothetical protein